MARRRKKHVCTVQVQVPFGIASKQQTIADVGALPPFSNEMRSFQVGFQRREPAKRLITINAHSVLASHRVAWVVRTCTCERAKGSAGCLVGQGLGGLGNRGQCMPVDGWAVHAGIVPRLLRLRPPGQAAKSNYQTVQCRSS